MKIKQYTEKQINRVDPELFLLVMVTGNEPSVMDGKELIKLYKEDFLKHDFEVFAPEGTEKPKANLSNAFNWMVENECRNYWDAYVVHKGKLVEVEYI